MAPKQSLYERLRAAILIGEYHPGEVLVETAVAKAFGVSRTPIREAFRRLEQDGILQRHDRNLVVHEPSPQEALEIYDCLATLEGMAAECAARRATDYDVAVIRRTHAQMADLEEREPAEMMAINHAFHVSIWQGSHNATLYDLLERLMVHVSRYSEPSMSQPGRWEAAIQEHQLILDAIAAGDEVGAREAIVGHTIAARNLRLEMIARGSERGLAARP